MAKSLRILPPLAGALLCLSAISTSCQDERQSYVQNVGDGSQTPTMLTTEVSTFISDSGYTRYHITAPTWGMYDEAQEPFWLFPDGLELEQYDRDFNPNSNFRCDSARYVTQKRVWRFDGNVVMVNVQRDTFLTQQVFWDQLKREVYSDSFVHIVRSDRVIEGYGFTSNEAMTAYTVNRPTGIFPVDKPGAGTQQSEEADTAQAVPQPPRRRSTAPVRASERQELESDASIPIPGEPHNDTRLQRSTH